MQGDNKLFLHHKMVYGGTEYMASTWQRKVLPSLTNIHNYQCYVLPGQLAPLSEMLKDKRDIIIWIHNLPHQFHGTFDLVYIKNKLFMEKVKYFIVPSENAKEYTVRELGISADKVWVCNNAIFPLEYNSKKFNKPKEIKVVHTSAFDRGTPVILNSLQFIDVDFRLEIFNDFNPDLNFYGDSSSLDKRIKFYGKTPKSIVKEHVENAHIFIYPPDIFLETFCLSLVESLSAGNLAVYADYGSLKEVANGGGICYPHPGGQNLKHAEIFAKHFTEAIEKVKAGEWDPAEQVAYINKRFSWETITQQWVDLDNTL